MGLVFEHARDNNWIVRVRGMMINRFLWVFVFVATLAASASAEVMDKELPLSTLCPYSVIALLVCCFAARVLPKALWVLVPVAFFCYFGILNEVTDKYVGPAIARESGPVYVWTVYLMPLVFFACITLCLRWRKMSLRKGHALTSR